MAIHFEHDCSLKSWEILDVEQKGEEDIVKPVALAYVEINGEQLRVPCNIIWLREDVYDAIQAKVTNCWVDSLTG